MVYRPMKPCQIGNLRFRTSVGFTSASNRNAHTTLVVLDLGA